ncbi:deoxyribose-phosphate aldolase [Fastidiosibacter lacustris]|uniref:deoxyribose-phosphate aldolase n=1 Tax=Fastidiosibacter lacustris TaxID=2056695 RepID=UPI000E34B49B|nr:deoxyribose-phosphate aldolase [Fastidiosibacter lacustris]
MLKYSDDIVKKVVSLIDLTSLNKEDNDQTIDTLIKKARNKLGQVAAICIYPEFIQYAKSKLGAGIRIATVINFPMANASLEVVKKEVEHALKLGADELDLVIPYHDYINLGESPISIEMVKACKRLCQNKVLKVIIESGELTISQVGKVSRDMIEAGADFLKTSTGKTATGATLDAAKEMLIAIANSSRVVGFKASGGIRSLEDALEYIDLARVICGESYINAQFFRFGVSGLLDSILQSNPIMNNY